MFTALRSTCTAIAIFATAAILAGPVAAAQSEVETAAATINEHDVAAAATGEPLRLYPGESVDVVVDLVNHGDRPVQITQVQLDGRVIGLTFFSYATSVDLTVAPGARDTVRYRLDLTGLKGQATGLLGAELIIRDRAGDAVAVLPTVIDVRGSLRSVYGFFGMALVVLTALALADAALALARHRLSANRWQRGLRLLTPGIGIGLVLAFSASVARWWVPSTGVWLLVAGLTAAAFFALGYFSPTPYLSHLDDATDLEDTDLDDTDLDDIADLDVAVGNFLDTVSTEEIGP